MTDPKEPKATIEYLDPSIIKTNDRGRKDFKHMQELMESIEKFGVAHPIVVSKNEDGTFTLIAGERRLRAMMLLLYKKIPCNVRNDLTAVEMKELELEENIQRDDLTWVEKNDIRLQVDQIKRDIYGDVKEGKIDKETGENKGWSLKKTAELAGESVGRTSDRITFAKQMKERPDIAERVKHLPESAAKKEFERILTTEKLGRLHDKGLLNVKSEMVLGNCLELIKNIPNESVALILTDPPFGIEAISSSQGHYAKATGTARAMLADEDNLTPAKAMEIQRALFPELERVLIPGGHFYIFFAMQFYNTLSAALCGAGLKPEIQPLIWDKGRATGAFSGQSYTSSYEPILYGMKKPWDRRLSTASRNVIQFPPVDPRFKIHPFEKPQELLRFLIKQSSRVGETVLDPFAGSGSTILASTAEGRKGLGFEFSERHFLLAQSRLILEAKEVSNVIRNKSTE